jgi:hypothetical protein
LCGDLVKKKDWSYKEKILELTDEIKVFKIAKAQRKMTTFSSKAHSSSMDHSGSSSHIKRPMNAFMVGIFLNVQLPRANLLLIFS